jgi:hypothetical protein
MLTGGRPLQQVAAGQLACEPHPDPAAGKRHIGQPLRHQVVERAVEVSERDIDRDPGDRQRLRGRAIANGPAR